jgi:thiamine kinase-like enzyme
LLTARATRRRLRPSETPCAACNRDSIHGTYREYSSNVLKSNSQLPELPSGITPQWLTGVLRGAGRIPPDARLTEIRRSQVGAGSGMMSELSRLSLTWSTPESGLPASLIAKYSSTNPTNRQVAMDFHVYEREVRYFREVDARTTARTPRCYLAELQGENFVILMDDLGDYRVGSQAAGANLADSQLVIDELASLHAPFWEKVEDLGWVPHVANSYHATNMSTFARSGWNNTMRVFGRCIPDTVRRQLDALPDAIPALQARMDSAPITFVHGDMRLDNLLFGTQPGHFPVVMIDWQGPLLSRGVFDLALFLGHNALADVRREHERALLRRYVDRLASLGVTYPFDEAWDHYLDALLFQWVYAIVVSGTLDSSDPRAEAWMAQMIARQAAATKDLMLLDRLAGFA